MEMATQTCEVCGIEIVQTPKKKPKRFCSGKCRSAWWHQYHKEHYEEEGTRTRICEFCGKRFPIQWESAESRKYCSHECYINARYHSSEKDVTGQFTEAATLVASAIDHLDDAEEGITDKLTRYSRNPYVRINLKKRRVEINALFQSAAVPFSDKALSEVLRIFEIDPEQLSDEELDAISAKLKRARKLHKFKYDVTPFDSEIAVRIAMNRMVTLENDIEEMLHQIGDFKKNMSPKERKALCLMLEAFPKDPTGKYTKQYFFGAVGISRNSYYKFVNNPRAGMDVAERDARDEADVRMAFEYKGYPKGVRMVYMLIPRLTGRKIGLDRVRRIMRKYNMNCRIRVPSERKETTQQLLKERRKPNLLRRMFKLHRPNEVRLTDVTVIECADQLDAYGSALIDPVTGVLVAFNVSVHNDLDLAMATLHNADRHPCKDGGTIHSDQGTLYLSPEFQAKVEAMGMEQSMSRRGNCWDNAPQESFFGHFKDDCREKYRQCRTIQELRKVIEEYAYYYNYERGMWDRNHMTPMDYEAYLLSLTDEEYAAYMEQETERFIRKKEEAKMKAIERNRNGL